MTKITFVKIMSAGMAALALGGCEAAVVPPEPVTTSITTTTTTYPETYPDYYNSDEYRFRNEYYQEYPNNMR